MTTETEAPARVVTPWGRLSYPKLLRPELNNLSGKIEYSTVLIVPKTENLAKLKELCARACEAKWGKDWRKKYPGLRTPFRDGQEKNGTEGYGPDVIFFSARQDPSKGKPIVVGPDGADIDPADPTAVYPGRWARMSVRAYAYTTGKPGVAFGLVNVQLGEHDDALGGSGPVDPSDDFEPVKITRPGPTRGPGNKSDPFGDDPLGEGAGESDPLGI